MNTDETELAELRQELEFRKDRAKYWRDYYYALKDFLPEELRNSWDQKLGVGNTPKSTRVQVWMALTDERTDIDWALRYHNCPAHVGPIWGLSPNDVEGKIFDDGAIEAIQELNPQNIPENAFAIKFLMTDLEWESGDPECGMPSGWMMKAEVLGYDYLPESEQEAKDSRESALSDGRPETFKELLDQKQKEDADTDKIIAQILNAPLAFDLKAQGHIPTIEKMLDAGDSWDAIATVIGWDKNTLWKHWCLIATERGRNMQGGKL